MFGYIIANKAEMKFKEFDIYHAYYCGLCQKLREKYGNDDYDNEQDYYVESWKVIE